MNKHQSPFNHFATDTVSRRDVVRRTSRGAIAVSLAGALGMGVQTAKAKSQDADLSGSLTIWGWEAALSSLQVVDAAFNEAYPNITLEYVQKDTSDVYQQIQLAASAGSGFPDISVIEDSHLAQFAPLGILADLTDQVAPYLQIMNDFKWNQAEVDQRYYAMPWDSGPVAVFYRRDVFEQAGIDPESIATWEDYYNAAKTINEELGVAMLHLAKARNDTRTFEILLWQQGLGYIDAEGTVILDTESRVQQTLEYLGRFWQEGLAADTESWTDAWYQEMADGEVATIPGAVWMGTFLKSFIAPDAAGKWGVFKLPTWGPEGSQASNDGGSSLAIFQTTEQQEAAWAYVEFHLGRVESQLEMYRETDIFPALETTYTDPLFEEPDPYFGGQPVRALFAETVGNIPDAGIYSADYQEMNSLLGSELQRFAIGEQTAEEALKNAADAIRERTRRS
ncbi:MAG TPA: sugar ABC transporter substrate-binding protein [Thermomicrobiales bacterium]|nr:sugar ABC transporter substrate-binding protein [Thermomicrobiales bacterium]